MTFLEDIRAEVERLGVFKELDVETPRLPAAALELSDRSVRDALTETASLIRQATTLQTVLAGIASTRSSRERGHTGLVQETGHRTAVEFIREITGATRGEAIRTVRGGEALLGGVTLNAGGDDAATDSPGAGLADDTPALDDAPVPWHQPLSDALLAGALTTAQHAAILRGLGDPPSAAGSDGELAWRAAAEQLVAEVPACTVEDLGARARTVRDLADPAGAADRFEARYAKRSYRTWVDADGVRHGSLVYDDEMGAWMQNLFDTALSPRRGGPRFTSADDKQAAEDLAADPRTNEQLAYDLLTDLLRAGARAEAKDVFGAREAGVRLVTMRDAVTGAAAQRDAFGPLVAVACSEDGQITLPGAILESAMCTLGTIDVHTDTRGNPLDVGREQRLFTARQRLTLGQRDGGCVWTGCDRPPMYCEVHHIDEWARGGSTDCDRGVLLCRFHHLHLHNDGWRITRDGDGPFVLHPPPHLGLQPIPLVSKSPMRWLFDPPPDRSPWRQSA